MLYYPTRRRFLKSAVATGAALGLGDLSFLSRLPRISAAEAQLDPKIVRFHPDIEPLVRLLEDTPREKLLEEVGSRLPVTPTAHLRARVCSGQKLRIFSGSVLASSTSNGIQLVEEGIASGRLR